MTEAIALDMIAHYTASFRLLWWWALPAIVLACVSVLVPRIPARWSRVTRNALLVPCIAGGIYWAWQLRWLCDDAFISFRYAQNLVTGHGLVYNIGERVEGYTNFLWTLLLAGTSALGLDPPRTSLVLSLASFAALLACANRIPGLVMRDQPVLPVSIAALICAAQYTMASFATSGLETMFGSLLALVALERSLAGAYFAAGTAGIAATMTHPDLAILYAALGAAITLDRSTRKGLLRYALPFLVFYAPYFAWRWHYYGDLFPNTYYVKSANLVYLQQGSVYLAAFGIGSGLWAALPIIAYGAWSTRRTLFGRYCVLAIPMFCVYIAKIGGDFMHGRLLCPIVAPLLLLAEVGVAHLFANRQRTFAALGILTLAVVCVPARIVPPLDKVWQLADERTFYELTSIDPIRIRSIYFEWGKTLARHFKPNRARPHLSMYSAGMISYYTGWPMLDGFGLTDRLVAHRPIAVRGRPGHEKHASPAYVVSRGVDISDEPTWPAPYADVARLMLSGTKFNLVHYDPALLASVRHRESAIFTDYERRLRNDAARVVTPYSAERIACDAWFAEAYYFSRVPDSPMRARITAQLLAAGRPLNSSVPTAPPASINLARLRPEPQSALHFDRAERPRFSLSGDAFNAFPTAEPPPSQEWVTGNRGAFVDTFDATSGDAARGRLVSQPFALVGDVMELYVGGPFHSDKVRVSLLVDGARVFTTGGCDSEMMGRRLWQIAPFKGKNAVLEIVDNGTQFGEHLLVDEVVQWVPKSG